ncbi:ImmA/IrrE family metallo-endopeptidase [Alicyclobacillus fastidiosus]|uniref:ImmA/IrrE family metallo-endopeptidase n=1 Tax=Alicyclobacillus fastidiosus TaxID=392011 RepID=A0ABV5AKD3_9BACL|nr:ImmA/IrrE family metallo-endopeptidase [Alicyclobacillus fastidiosus]WEH09314.1 ImmA/IrrE family metallo-endopeptidase [Alicyclobacillus fastidiosus]
MQFEDLELYKPTPMEAAIQTLYKRHHIVSPCDIDMDRMAGELGVEVRYLAHESNTAKLGSKYFVIVDDRVHWTQQRIEFAHELGHILMHYGNQLNMPPDFKNLQEWQADRFAMYALAPTFMIANCITNAYSRQQLVRQLAETFDVTDVFMDVRLDILEQRLRSLAWDRHVKTVVQLERQMYDYTYPHPTDKRIEYLVKDGIVIGRRRRAE